MPQTNEQQRLLELKAMQIDFNSEFQIKADDTSEEELVLEGFASTDSKDRASDIIPLSTWADPDSIANYLKNPIILAQHDRDEPVGKCESLQVKDGGLFVRVRIYKSLCEKTFMAVKHGILKTFSVGFRLKDIEYAEEQDAYLLTKVELTEISIVSIPCNTDATFAVMKSLSTGTNKRQENNPMPAPIVTPEATEVQKAVEAELAKRDAAAKAEALAKQKELDIQAATADIILSKLKADNAATTDKLMTDIKAALADESKTLNDVVNQFKAEIDANKAALEAAQKSKMEHPQGGKDSGPITQAQKDAAVLLGIVTKKGTFGTKMGIEYREKAAGFNAANSAVHIPGAHTINASDWETEFVTNLWYDIRRELVIEPLFRTIQMSTAIMRMPVVPEQGYASYIPVDLLKTTGSTEAANPGNRPTEITLTAHKLSASDILGEEEQEDTIIAILPLIRDNLVRRMARSSDRSLLRGVGATAADPIKGLAKYAIDNSKTTTLSIGGGDKLTALALQQTRRLLGIFGTRPQDIAYIVSTDGYYDLLEDPDMRKAFDVGVDRATMLKGEVANVNGTKLIVSDEWAAKASGATAAMVVNMRNYVVGNLRNLTVKTDNRIELDGTLIVATRRFGMAEMEAGGVAVVNWAV